MSIACDPCVAFRPHPYYAEFSRASLSFEIYHTITPPPVVLR